LSLKKGIGCLLRGNVFAAEASPSLPPVFLFRGADCFSTLLSFPDHPGFILFILVENLGSFCHYKKVPFRFFKNKNAFIIKIPEGDRRGREEAPGVDKIFGG
jgi:hypothetical protein